MQAKYISKAHRSLVFRRSFIGRDALLNLITQATSQDLKVLLLISILNYIMKQLKQKIEAQQKQQLMYHKKLEENYKLHGSYSVCKINPKSQKIRQLQAQYQHFYLLNGQLKIFLQEKKRKLLLGANCLSQSSSLDKTSFVKLDHEQLTKSHSKVLQNISIPNLRKTTLHLNFTTKITPIKQTNRFKSKKKEEIYLFSKLNKTILNFTKHSQQLDASAREMFRFYINTLQKTNFIITKNAHIILSSNQQCRQRFAYYIKTNQKILHEIEDFLRVVLSYNNHKCINNDGFKQQQILKKQASYQKNYPLLQQEINFFTMKSARVMDMIRMFLNFVYLAQSLKKQRSRYEKIIPKIMQSRYNLNYMLKDAQNVSLPFMKQKIKNRKQFEAQIENNKKWKLAFIKKFETTQNYNNLLYLR